MNERSRYSGAEALLPVSLRGEVKLPEYLEETAEEIRLRAGRKASA